MDEIRSDVVYTGTVIFTGTVGLPNNVFGGTQFNTADPLPTSKALHRHALRHSQKDGADVVSETVLLHVARAAGQPVSFQVRPTTAPTGGDKQFTVDVQKSANGTNTWASILTTPVVMSSADANGTLNSGVLSGTPTHAAGDAYRIVITASGSTGSQGQGFVATLNLDENPS